MIDSHEWPEDKPEESEVEGSSRSDSSTMSIFFVWIGWSICYNRRARKFGWLGIVAFMEVLHDVQAQGVHAD
jgi:hypothetical protein